MTNSISNAVAAREASPGEQVARIVRARVEPGAFLASLIKGQCEVAHAVAGAFLQVEPRGKTQVLAIASARGGSASMEWVEQARAMAAAVSSTGDPRAEPLTVVGSDEHRLTNPHLVLVPCPPWHGKHVLSAFLVEVPTPGALRTALDRLELTSGLLGLRDVQIKMRAREQIVEKLRVAMIVLEIVNEQDRFQAAAMAFCNEVASRWHGERVTLGFLDGRYVKTSAMSHTERFDRKMKLVQDIESAMEECFDQDTEVVHPRPEESIYVSRATQQLSSRHGPLAVASLPLRRHGRVIGVLTVERCLDEPLAGADIEMLRLTCEFITPRLVELRRTDRWIGARAASATVEALRGALGPQHTGVKILVLALLAFALFLTFVHGDDRIDASFAIAAIERRVVPAPFDGRLERVDVRPGDEVQEGKSVLAVLETADLQMQLAATQAERAGHLKEADLALRDGNTVEVQIAEAHLHRTEAEIRLLEHRIAQATIAAPIAGTVVSGDLEQRLGAPVEMGEVLFAIARLDGLRADIELPEDRIADLMGDGGAWSLSAGRLASVTHPGDRIPFEIEHIYPVAEVIDQRNVFRARVRLLEDRPWLRPGMTGVAKISVGRKSYGALWTRRLVAWLRMRLWV